MWMELSTKYGTVSVYSQEWVYCMSIVIFVTIWVSVQWLKNDVCFQWDPPPQEINVEQRLKGEQSSFTNVIIQDWQVSY